MLTNFHQGWGWVFLSKTCTMKIILLTNRNFDVCLIIIDVKFHYKYHLILRSVAIYIDEPQIKIIN